MTDDNIALRELVEDKRPTLICSREMIGFAAERLMELEVLGLTFLERRRSLSTTDGRREGGLGMAIGASEAGETFWVRFPRKLKRRRVDARDFRSIGPAAQEALRRRAIVLRSSGAA